MVMNNYNSLLLFASHYLIFRKNSKNKKLEFVWKKGKLI